MKKLRLKALELGAKEVLTREQLKNVLGGNGSGIYGTPGGNNGNPCPQYCIGGIIVAINQSMNYVNSTQNCNSVPSEYQNGCHNACFLQATGSFWC